MYRRIIIITLLIGLAFICTSCKGDAKEKKFTGSKPIWPCPTGSFTGENSTNLNCPTRPTPLWSIELEGAQCTPPLVDGKGRIILGTPANLRCFSNEGVEVWSAEIATHIKGPPVLSLTSHTVVAFGTEVTLVDGSGRVAGKSEITEFATHHPAVDSQGNIYIYCMAPTNLADIAPNPPRDLQAQSTFNGHIYKFGPNLKPIEHIDTGIINCPLRPFPAALNKPGVVYGPKIFKEWRYDAPADPARWETVLTDTASSINEPLGGIEHGVVDMFITTDGIIHLFGHTEHFPYPDELNAPMNEYGFVYRVLLQSYNPNEKLLNKGHWPWMTPEDASVGTYKDFRTHFNRVRFIHNIEGQPAYQPVSEADASDDEHDHADGPGIHPEVRQFLAGCRHMIITESGMIIGGLDSIQCFDVAVNRVIWEIDGDPSTIALDNEGNLYCLERIPEEDKCFLKCYTEGKYGGGFRP